MADIAKLRALRSQARDTPWHVRGETEFVNQIAVDPTICVFYGDKAQATGHAGLLVAAVSALPALLDVAEAARVMCEDSCGANLGRLRAALARLEEA